MKSQFTFRAAMDAVMTLSLLFLAVFVLTGQEIYEGLWAVLVYDLGRALQKAGKQKGASA